MDLNALRAHLKKTLSAVYLLCGPESLLREEAEGVIRARAGAEAGDCEEIILWASEGASLREAVEEALTRPLFAARKFIVFREADEELKRNAGALRSYLRSPAAFSTLVLECLIEKKGGFKGALVVECGRLYETEYGRPGVSAMSPLGKWLRARASRMRVELGAEATVGLIEAVGTDLRELVSAVGLVAMNCEDGRVAVAEIEEMFSRSRASPAWRLAEALLEGERESAMELAREALDSGVEFSGGKVVRGDGAVAAVLMVVLARELESLQLACAMLEEGTRERDVLRRLKVPRHRGDAFIRRAKNSSAEACAFALEAILEQETGFKTGRVEPGLALIEAVARIGEIWKDVGSSVRQAGGR